MSQREARGVPAVPGAEHGRAKAEARPLPDSGRKRSHPGRTRQDLWGQTRWSHQRWSRAAPGPRGARARGLALSGSEAGPKNAAREQSRVRTLRQAFLALQAALPAVPPGTKLSKLDVLVLAASYIAHLGHVLGHAPPGPIGPPGPPFPREIRHLHPLKKWPMRSRLYAGGLGSSGPDSTTASASGQRTRDAEVGPPSPGEADALLPTKPPSPALGDE
ncbi:transcription factor 23 [Carlito syrichta]|uniref:Transcription factor 23 n=1 Tax=Carlito syrichta TaxID=1868482 RepID=A0A1U7U6F6_CARSF|nr:transcription factor 23 [Carlito syrichta]